MPVGYLTVAVEKNVNVKLSNDQWRWRICVLCVQARSAEIPELRTEPLMRSCSSSTASMKVKNVKKWVDGHTPASVSLIHLSPSHCSSLTTHFLLALYGLCFLLELLVFHEPISVSSPSFYSFSVHCIGCFHEQWMMCSQTQYFCVLCFQTSLHQGPLSKTGGVRSLPLWKCGLWHNPGKDFSLKTISY